MKRKQLWQAFRAFFSLGYLRYRLLHLAYSLHESVVWRKYIHAGKKLRVHPTASIRNAQNIHIGTNSHINMNCCVWASENATIRLGDNLLMGPGVQIHGDRHGLKPGEPMTFQPMVCEDIQIGNDVWLCGGVIVTAGVTIADGVVVAANAVVTKDLLEENAIAGGIPAKIIGKRK